ncbi:MAG: TIGR03936 family radical SAM-associated protein [Candidatus Muirbacterium halophilum]|nr:TIGR03936 family radical SAM-associated protein [Candidatus Muirbacterium halophilum]MCK9475398.1 TIGR03936 family radical SAM-associated protein [Candidatus Muirbacterium halophilum]
MFRYVIKYILKDNAGLLSHLELVRFFERAFRRNGLKLAFSEGFNPHAKIRNAGAKSVGVESICEYLEFYTIDNIDEKTLINDKWFNGNIKILDIFKEKNDAPKINRQINFMIYRFSDFKINDDFQIDEFKGINSYKIEHNMLILNTISEFSFSRFSSEISFSKAERELIKK